MSSNEQPANESDDGLAVEKTPCVALVPVARPPQRSPDSKFVTHLIATAAHAPQTRGLRRASLADARTAYNASQNPVGRTGIRMLQVI
jgi:hypothetical protein